MAKQKHAVVAHNLVNRAIAKGEMVRPAACQLCARESLYPGDISGHHWRGYEYPYDVWWICNRCNSCPRLIHDGTQTIEQAKAIVTAAQLRPRKAKSKNGVNLADRSLRAVLAHLAGTWLSLPVYVVCSGNFAAERILASKGITQLHSNGTSLYSLAVGSHLADRPFTVRVRDANLDWLTPYLTTGVSTIATLLLCNTLLEAYGKDDAHHLRLWAAYKSRFPRLHKETCAKLEQSLAGPKLTSFSACDSLDFLVSVPAESAVVVLPPAPVKGAKRFKAAFVWDEPAVEVFTDHRFASIVAEMQKKRCWTLFAEEEIGELSARHVASTQKHQLAPAVHVYSNTQATTKLTVGREKNEPVLCPRVTDEPPQWPLSLIRLNKGQFNSLLSQYLAVGITPSICRFRFGLLAAGKLVGAFGFSPSSTPAMGDIYMLSDFAVAAPQDWRLAKLILACTLSKEVKAVLEQSMRTRINMIGTTAFTDKAVSMKYRGLFDLHSRKPGRLNYIGNAGRFTLREAFAWWQKKTSPG